LFKNAPDLSIIVPTLNELENVSLLVERIDASLKATCIRYEIIFVDDHSSDGTYEKIVELSRSYPIAAYRKVGKQGKSYSLLQGIRTATSDILCMIDADLQYPPEDIAPMVRLLVANKADVILSTRLQHETSYLRQLASKTYNLLFTKLLFGIDYDTQSGLKVFRKDIFADMRLNPSPWSFDLEFILQCLVRQYRILTYDIVFASRHSGKVKLKIVKTAFELAKASLLLRTKISRREIKPAYQENVRFDSNIAKATS
jgi:dolichol-phosphate mannosyltransferase